MKYHFLGNTDMKVSHVSMGGASFSNIYGFLKSQILVIFGKPKYITTSNVFNVCRQHIITTIRNKLYKKYPRSFDEEKSLELIKKTLSMGVNYLETGPWYGQGSSEKIIGKALKDISRETYYIGSKVGRYEKDIQKMFDFSSEKTEAAVDNTLKLLGLEYVDLIQMHDVTFAPDMSIILKETLPTLDRAVKDGKARYIGIADYDLELMKEIIEETDIKLSTILSYSKSTLFDNRLQNYTKYFKRKGVGIINAAATGMGLLTNGGPQPWHPASDDVKVICKQASDYCKNQGVELARLATWFTLNQPDVDTNVCGFYNIEQMEDTLNVSEKGLTEQEKAVLAHLQLRFFDNVTLHWDEIELNAYKAKLENVTA